MSKDKKKDPQNNETKSNMPKQVAINAQYIKDLSFENPGAPATLSASDSPPQIDVAVDIKVKKIQDNSFEVALNVTNKAHTNENPLFILELDYAGVFTIQASEEELEPLLMVYCPSILFPFARRIIADTTRDGGFPPLMLDPFDFATLYMKHKQEDNK